MTGAFVEADGQTWYRIDHLDDQQPFFIALAGDSDLWAFLSTAGSLAAGRRDPDGAFLPYETVDKIHRRWQHTGPRTWIRLREGDGANTTTTLWQPFAPRLAGGVGERSVWKNLSGTRVRLREQHPGGRLAFEVEWATPALGLVRRARLLRLDDGSAPLQVQVLDGLLNLVPPGVDVAHASTMSSLTDAYKWNESAAGGRLGLFTLYAQIWDRAEPKESFHALAAWHAGLPPTITPRTLLSDHQVDRFCATGAVQPETLTRGRRGAFLLQFEADLGRDALAWQIVVDGPCPQVRAFELAQSLAAGQLGSAEIDDALARNDAGVDELLARADGFQQSTDTMATAHHRANVLFNIMRGGVFADGTRLARDDLLAFARQRHRLLAARLEALARSWPPQIERADAMRAARGADPALERLVLEYLPLTFSRRHGDPSRPWNRFSIRVRDEAGARMLNHQGNWRDIFQNWEALVPSTPAFVGSMITAFLGAMTPDGHNPYRVSRDGIDWEVPEPDNPWSNIGYWGDHQVVYLLRLLEAADAHDPALLPDLWDRTLFSFADVPYRLLTHAQQTAQPKSTIRFDEEAHLAALARADALGSDGLRVCDDAGLPVLATLAEKLLITVLAKAATLVPGGGLWLHTQRPEWNDANNALVGNGLSLVTLAHLRRLLAFVLALPGAERPFALSPATLATAQGLLALLQATPTSACDDAVARRAYLDAAGQLMDGWCASGYHGAEGRYPAGARATAPTGLLRSLAQALLPLVDATLLHNRRSDGLAHSYNLVDLRTAGRAEVGHLYLMLEGQVALLSSGLLAPPDAVALLDALFASPLLCPRRRSFLLYPDRALPGFFERNRLDAAALALPIVQTVLDAGRHDLLQQQSDGTVRFAPGLANRTDLEAAGTDLGAALAPLADAYERLLQHHAFTGRSGTMFGYEGLGCIYWHMVAKLLLAVQENVWAAADQASPALPALVQHYRRVRDGLGYRKTPAEYGAFPADPYSHTPGEGGAQQPGMTGQVKEEILTRWGELGLRVRGGRVHLQPLLLDDTELPLGGTLRFTWGQRPFTYHRGDATSLRVQTASGWEDCPDLSFAPEGVLAVEATVALGSG